MARRKPKSGIQRNQPSEKKQSPESPSLKRLKRFKSKAEKEYQSMKPLLDEAFDYAIPFRKGSSDGTGQARVNKAFDQTAIVGAFRFAGRLWQDFVSEEMFKLKPGDILPKNIKDGLRPELEKYTAVLTALCSNGEFDLAFHEMGLDLAASTGAMLIQQGEDKDNPVDFITVPIDELRLLGGPKGNVIGTFWDRKWPVWQIKEEYEDDKSRFGEKLKDLIKNKPEDEITLSVATLYDRKTKRWITSTWAECDDVIFREEKTRTNPWITPRYFRVPGETMGRGVIMLAMPSIKTLNTAQSLSLQSAAIALLGIWTAVDDGVFNPDMSDIEPGAIWTVARNGGVLGPSIQRMQDPRIDVSNIILNDLRMAVQSTMMDQSLPPDGASVRSATEILERVKRLASDHTGAFGRLVYEIIVPLARRLLEIASNLNLVEKGLDIDQLLVQVNVSSPIATSRAAQRMEKIVQFAEMCLAILQERAGSVVKLEEALEHIGHELGVPSEFVVTDEERKVMREREEQIATMTAAAQAMGQAQAEGAAE